MCMAQFEIKLSGELSTNCLSAGEDVPEYGILVDPLVRTPQPPPCLIN